LNNITVKNEIAIIGFSHLMSPIPNAWPSTHRALLPLAGKPMIIHQIEWLARTGFKEIRISGSIQQLAARRVLSNGEQWGLSIKYSDLSPDDIKAECLALGREYIYVICDELLLNSNQDITHSNKIESAEEYHLANLLVLNNPSDYVIPGAKIHNSNAHSDWNSMISSDAYIGENVFIGKNSQVNNLAQLKKNCILSEGVLIGKRTVLENVTVLPNCKISSDLIISNCIITSSGIIDFDGIYYNFKDSDYLRQSRSNNEITTGMPTQKIAF